MSHNELNVNEVEPDLNGSIPLKLTDLGGFTSSVASAFLGVDGSSNPKIVSLSSSTYLNVVYNVSIKSAGWGGAANYSLNYALPWRRASDGDEYVDSTYCSISYSYGGGTWADQITLTSGKYFLFASMPASSSSSSNTLNARLYNTSNSTYIGPTFQKGNKKGSNLFFTYLDLSSTSTLEYRVTALSGTWSLPSSYTHRGCRITVVRIV